MNAIQLYRTVEHLKKTAGIPNPFVANKTDIAGLQQEVGELRLHIAVLYRLLLTKGFFTEAEVQSLIDSIDLADGNADGQFDGDPVTGVPIAEDPADITYPEIRTKTDPAIVLPP